ncbi:hypothetical protein BANRA_05713 [Klebsiella pneumoniae]|nr:hypothetical protein BANRA_05713 [Klebsiella pneumoniae]
MAGDKPKFVKEIIERLNSLFGEATPIQDQVAFVNQIFSIAGESDVVMAQVSNTREQAMKGNLPGAVQQAVVRALSSHQAGKAQSVGRGTRGHSGYAARQGIDLGMVADA